MNTVRRFPIDISTPKRHQIPKGFIVRHVGFANNNEKFPSVFVEVNAKDSVNQTVQFVCIKNWETFDPCLTYAGAFSTGETTFLVYYSIV